MAVEVDAERRLVVMGTLASYLSNDLLFVTSTDDGSGRIRAKLLDCVIEGISVPEPLPTPGSLVEVAGRLRVDGDEIWIDADV